jgi:hypothetical protein
MSSKVRPAVIELSLGTMHAGQVAAFRALQPHRFKVLRCGRRFGKTDFAKMWIGQGLVQGEECAWFAPQPQDLVGSLSGIGQHSSTDLGHEFEGIGGDAV